MIHRGETAGRGNRRGSSPDRPASTVIASLVAIALASVGTGTCRGFDARVGTETCFACHDGRLAPDQRSFVESAHFLNGIQCEECHGPGFAHVRVGGRNGVFIEPLNDRPVSEAHLLCAKCHASPTSGFLASGHFLLGAATCTDCHNVHTATGLTAPQETNALCQQCHSAFEFPNVEAVDFHTGPFHPVDPAGSGASRCSNCHMPPLEQRIPRGGPRSHTMRVVSPQDVLDAAAMGVTPLPPSSCAGVAGCHDPAVPGSGPPRDPNDLELLESLIPFFELIGGVPSRTNDG